MSEKTLELLKADFEKKEKAVKDLEEKLAEATKASEEKPEDSKLKNKVAGLTGTLKKAEQNLADAKVAIESFNPDAFSEEDKNAEGAEKDSGSESDKGKDDPQKNEEPKKSATSKPSEKKVRLRVKSKTGKPTYYRAGLCFTKTESDIEVSEDVAETLKKDLWLNVELVK